MYLKGLSQDAGVPGTTETYTDLYPSTTMPVVYTPPDTPAANLPGAGPDWTGLLLNTLKTFAAPQSTIPPGYVISPTGQLVPAAYQPMTPYYTSPLPRAAPGYSPFPGSGVASGGTIFGMSMNTFLLLGAIGIAAFIFFRK